MLSSRRDCPVPREGTPFRAKMTQPSGCLHRPPEASRSRRSTTASAWPAGRAGIQRFRKGCDVGFDRSVRGPLDRKFGLLLAGAVVVGAALRLPFVGHQSLGIDETYT